MSIVAKVRCIGNGPAPYDTSGADEFRIVRFTAVYDPDAASRNYEWSKATPYGYVELAVTKPEAFGRFEVGHEYLLTFEEATE